MNTNLNNLAINDDEDNYYEDEDDYYEYEDNYYEDEDKGDGEEDGDVNSEDDSYYSDEDDDENYEEDDLEVINFVDSNGNFCGTYGNHPDDYSYCYDYYYDSFDF